MPLFTVYMYLRSCKLHEAIESSSCVSLSLMDSGRGLDQHAWNGGVQYAYTRGILVIRSQRHFVAVGLWSKQGKALCAIVGWMGGPQIRGMFIATWCIVSLKYCIDSIDLTKGTAIDIACYAGTVIITISRLVGFDFMCWQILGPSGCWWVVGIALGHDLWLLSLMSRASCAFSLGIGECWELWQWPWGAGDLETGRGVAVLALTWGPWVVDAVMLPRSLWLWFRSDASG